MYDIKRQVFFSFHYDNDACFAAQVRNIGAIYGEPKFSDNEWEEVRKKDISSIKKWIDDQLYYRTCTIVLIGEQTWRRAWVQYEIARSWSLGKGVLGIYIHGLKDFKGRTRPQGNNPFLYAGDYIKKLFTAKAINVYDPTFIKQDWAGTYTENKTYQKITENIQSWIEYAIKQRNYYPK